MSILSNFDIEDVLKSLKVPLVCCVSKDQLPKKMKSGSYVVNMADSDNEGTHWVAFVIDKNKTYYFDSFGEYPPKDVLKYCNKCTDFYVSREEIQNINSVCCGWYVIAFLHYMYRRTNKKLALDTFLDMFDSDVTKNSTILDKYISKYVKLL